MPLAPPSAQTFELLHASDCPSAACTLANASAQRRTHRVVERMDDARGNLHVGEFLLLLSGKFGQFCICVPI